MSCKLIIEGIPNTTNEHQQLQFAREFHSLATDYRCDYEIRKPIEDYTGLYSFLFLTVLLSLLLWKFNPFGYKKDKDVK